MSRQFEITHTEILSDEKYQLKKVTFKSRKQNGDWESQSREIFDRGDGATVLLYNQEQNTVILTRQFRLPTYLNGNGSGWLIEACAGLLEGKDPEECIRQEAVEETGFKLSKVQKVCEAYMSPGAVTEKLHFFVAPYTSDMKVGGGGGLREEHENIEVMEIDFDKAYGMISSGEILDSKTIILLQHAKTTIFN